MMINRRRVCGGKSLPYPLADYVGTNGWVYFDTGYVPTGANIRIKTRFFYRWYVDNTSWVNWYGAYTGESVETYRIIRNGSSNTQVSYCNGSEANTSGQRLFNINYGETYDIDANKNHITINGVIKNDGAHSNTVNTGTLKIFSSPFSGRCYYMQIYDNDILVVDLVPVVYNNVGCFYDKVRKLLITPIGKGTTFTDEGEKVTLPAGYTQVEYIERGANNAYIDTRYVLDFSETIELKMSVISWTNAYVKIFGNYSDENSNCTRVTRDNVNNNNLLVEYNRKAGGGLIRVPMTLGQPFVLSLSNSEYVMDGVSYTPSGVTGNAYNSTLKILEDANIKARIYYVKIGNKRDFIPCISPNGYAGLFDLKEGLFYRGNTNNDFTAGPVV